MSFFRLIYLSSIIGGWCGFVGWLFTELIMGRAIDAGTSWSSFWAIVMATLVAIPIGGGISVASGLANPQLANLVKRLVIGLAGGLLGGLLGTLLGSCIFSGTQYIQSGFLLFIARIIGWSLIGIGIGAGMGGLDGLFERSLKRMRNGLIGGVIGGFLGGFFFPVVAWIAGDSAMTSRAVAFVLLGLSIGLFIGLAQVILKEAWLTVEQGFRPGRQVILGSELVSMGTSEKSTLIFIAFGAKGVEPNHLQVSKAPDGRFVLQDNRSRTGTFVNGAPIHGPTPLNDGDAIQLGVNVVRFRERVSHGGARQPLPPGKVAPAAPAPMPAPMMQPAAMPVKPVAPPVMPVHAVPKPAPVMKQAPHPAPVKVAPVRPAQVAVKPAAAPQPAAAQTPQEGRCPICDKRITGIPGKRRCDSCFTTF